MNSQIVAIEYAVALPKIYQTTDELYQIFI